jgi:NADPH-dependent curcumin reductase CurA
MRARGTGESSLAGGKLERSANRNGACDPRSDGECGGLLAGAAVPRRAVLPLLNDFARVPVCGLIAQYNGPSGGDGTDHLPATMRAILSKSLTLRGFLNYEFGEQHYSAFLREVGAGIADGSIRYREDIVDGLEKAPEAFIGMLDGHNFGKVIVRVDA